MIAYDDNDTQNIEIELLLEAIYRKYGYDFRDYSRAHVKRRILHRLVDSGAGSVSEIQGRILYDKKCFEKLIKDLSINVTEMFRDPDFYKTVRTEVIPVLKTYPYIKIWHAGCSTGEEVYSFAVMLKEEGLYDRTQIYATDFNRSVIETAKKGIYPIENIKNYTVNYQKAGGKNSFSDYYMAKYDSVILDQSLKSNIVFAEHNLVSDSVFAEVNMIICRNVLIYFNRKLQNKVLKLFDESLVKGGFLGLGSKETIMFSDIGSNYESISEKQKIYKRRIK